MTGRHYCVHCDSETVCESDNAGESCMCETCGQRKDGPHE